jgi:arsenate reductase-like glutaredoxin family protein
MEWCGLKSWELIFNKRSTTWKEIMASHKGLVNNQAEAVNIMHQHNSIIKRPVIEINGDIIVGFDEKEYLQKILKK